MTDHALTYKELRRSRDDRMLGGVCGGLARYFDVNPTFYRVGFVVLSLLGGAGILIYGAAYLVMPDEGESDSIASAVLRDRRQRPWALVGLLLVGVAAIVLLSRLSFHIHSGTWFWVLVLIVGAVVLQWQQRSSWPWDWRGARAADEPRPAATVQSTAQPSDEPPAAEPDISAATVSPKQAYMDDWYARRRRGGTFGITFGVLVVAGGILGLLAAAGVHIPWAVVIAIGAVTFGFGIVCGAILGRRVGGMAFLGLVLVGAALLASTVHLHLGGGVGNRTYAPVGAPGSDYRLGVGDLQLDLSKAVLTAPQTQVNARVGIGNVEVTVPRGVSVRVIGHSGAGDVKLLGHDANGHDVDQTVSAPGGVVTPRLVINARADIGRVLVTRSVR